MSDSLIGTDSPSSINTAMATTIPSQTASAPYMIANTAQLPQSLPYSFASSIVDPTQTSLSDSSLSTTHAASRPSAAAIAIPLAICALILLSALIFCARTRVARKPAAKNNDLEGRDWQAVIKEKAAAAKAGNNVVVTERIGERVIPPMDGNHYQDRGDRTSRNLRDGFHDGGFRGDRCMSEMSSRSGTRCLTPIRERERFTSIPTIDYGRHGRYGDRGSRCSLYSDSYHGHEPRKSWDYYTSSRRSSSSLGGVDEGFGPCAYHDRSSREKKDRGCIDCVREISHEGSIYNPHPARPMRQASSHSHSHTRPLPPLPEPMIRSSSSSTFQEQEQEWMATKKFGYLPPHKSGVLQRASSNASTDTNPAWKRDMRVGTGGGAGYGRYEDGEKGMGELYESLIRAIGTPR